MIVLIPAFEPDARLPRLVADLHDAADDLTVLVVDDGSGPRYDAVFVECQRLGAEVIGYATNRGKGYALKTGLRHIQRYLPGRDVVCADSDGQHVVADILRVAARITDGMIVLGGRAFAGEVPARSRVGNAVSRAVFRWATGVAVHDTQTGLRGYPASLLPWLVEVRGERFDYELRVLLASKNAGLQIDEETIETVYLEHNASSHFRPLVDSARVFAPLLKYAASSLSAFAVDAVGLVVIYAFSGSLLASVVGARLVSATVNFVVNRHIVFRGERGRLGRDILRYIALALALLASSYVWLEVLTQWGMPLVAAKLVADATLYIVSFQVQRRFVFRQPAPEPVTTSPSLQPSRPS